MKINQEQVKKVATDLLKSNTAQVGVGVGVASFVAGAGLVGAVIVGGIGSFLVANSTK